MALVIAGVLALELGGPGRPPEPLPPPRPPDPTEPAGADRTDGRRRKGERRRRELLAATVRLIGRLGVSAVTQRAVAAEAGLPPSAVLYYFDTVDGLLLATLRVINDRYLSALDALPADRTAALDALAGLIDRPGTGTAAGRVRALPAGRASAGTARRAGAWTAAWTRWPGGWSRTRPAGPASPRPSTGCSCARRPAPAPGGRARTVAVLRALAGPDGDGQEDSARFRTIEQECPEDRCRVPGPHGRDRCGARPVPAAHGDHRGPGRRTRHPRARRRPGHLAGPDAQFARGAGGALRRRSAARPGDVLEHLLTSEGVTLEAIRTDARNGGYVHDRRDGERVVIAEAPGGGRWTGTSTTSSTSWPCPRG